MTLAAKKVPGLLKSKLAKRSTAGTRCRDPERSSKDLKPDKVGTLSGSNSVVECQLPKLDVAGSIPVSRSNFQKPKLTFEQQQFPRRCPEKHQLRLGGAHNHKRSVLITGVSVISGEVWF